MVFSEFISMNVVSAAVPVAVKSRKELKKSRTGPFLSCISYSASSATINFFLIAVNNGILTGDGNGSGDGSGGLVFPRRPRPRDHRSGPPLASARLRSACEMGKTSVQGSGIGTGGGNGDGGERGCLGTSFSPKGGAFSTSPRGSTT